MISRSHRVSSSRYKELFLDCQNRQAAKNGLAERYAFCSMYQLFWLDIELGTVIVLILIVFYFLWKAPHVTQQPKTTFLGLEAHFCTIVKQAAIGLLGANCTGT